MDTVAIPVLEKARLFDSHLELLEAIPESAIIVDSSGLIVGSNQQLQKLFGYTRKELQGRHVESLIPERHHTKHISKRKQYSKTPSTQIMGGDKNIYGLHKSGKEIPVEVRIGSHTTEQGIFFTALVTDVTQRYWAQEHLKESESRLGVILDSTRAIPWAADPVTWEFTYVGPQAAEILGYPLEKWHEKDFWVNKIHPDDREAVIETCADFSKTHRDYELEYRMIASNDDVIWFHDIVNVEYKNGEPFILRGFLIDITARKNEEQKLQKEKQFSDRLRNELAHVNRMATMGELTASIAHELNQPLAAIMSNAQAVQQFLKNETPDIEEIKAALTDIISDDRRADEIIKRLRKLLLKGKPDNKPLSLTNIIMDVVKLVSNDAINKNVRILFENNHSKYPFLPPPLVSGDKIQLQQVALNLIMNALEAMDENEKDKRILVIKVFEHDDKVIVEFIDNGIGLKQQEFECSFDSFYTTKQKGMGMGLTISRTLIEAHGGQLAARKNQDGGATFYFSLPVVPGDSV